MNIHTLAGCSPTPLAHYLKALGILRLIAEQKKDETVRGWWRDETFHIATKLSRDEVEQFFLNEYQPTPLITPWNGGSGFYKNWDPKKSAFRNSVAYSARVRLEKSTAVRLEAYREYIRVIGKVILEKSIAVDVAKLTKKELDAFLLIPPLDDNGARAINADEQKTDLIARVYQVIPSDRRDFFDSVFALISSSDGKGADELITEAPPLWGTGGNDGKMEFANNQMRRLLELFDAASGEPAKGTDRLLRASLWRTTEPLAVFTPPLAADDKERSVGMLLPSDAGGPNMTAGFSADSQFNLWDYILMLEGAVVFMTGVSRRTITGGLSFARATAPFSMLASGIGSGSVAACDERTKKSTKAEQWVPMWPQPATWSEIRTLISEGRCQVGKATATRSVDVADAIARLGVARGLSEFVRIGFIERNGQSNLATPLGRWPVATKPNQFQTLLDNVSRWIERLKQAATDKKATKAIAIGRAARVCENAMLACCRDSSGGSSSVGAARWQQLFVALGEAEAQLVRSPAFTGKKGLQPLGKLGKFNDGLSPRWLLAINDRSPELRLALAFAGQHGVTVRTVNHQRCVEIDWNDPVRGHFMPLADARSGKNWAPRRFDVRSEKLAHKSRVVCSADDFERDAVSLMRRRVIEARQGGGAILPLMPVPGTEASLSDIQQFLAGELDAAKIMGLARPLMALNWSEFEGMGDKWKKELRQALADSSHKAEREAAGALGLFGLIRLCHFPGDVPVPRPAQDDAPDLPSTDHERGKWPGIPVRLDPSIIARLIAGGVQHAATIAARRLAVSGLRPKFSTAFADQFLGRRLVASLAFPISYVGALQLVERLTRPVLRSQMTTVIQLQTIHRWSQSAHEHVDCGGSTPLWNLPNAVWRIHCLTPDGSKSSGHSKNGKRCRVTATHNRKNHS